MAVKTVKVEAEAGDHVFIMVETPNRPTISIDISDHAGRRSLGVRTDGYSIFGGVVDVAWLSHDALKSEERGRVRPRRMRRYCPECGGEISLFSSASHVCPDEAEPEDAPPASD